MKRLISEYGLMLISMVVVVLFAVMYYILFSLPVYDTDGDGKADTSVINHLVLGDNSSINKSEQDKGIKEVEEKADLENKKAPYFTEAAGLGVSDFEIDSSSGYNLTKEKALSVIDLNVYRKSGDAYSWKKTLGSSNNGDISKVTVIAYKYYIQYNSDGSVKYEDVDVVDRYGHIIYNDDGTKKKNSVVAMYCYIPVKDTNGVVTSFKVYNEYGNCVKESMSVNDYKATTGDSSAKGSVVLLQAGNNNIVNNKDTISYVSNPKDLSVVDKISLTDKCGKVKVVYRYTDEATSTLKAEMTKIFIYKK